MSKVKTVIDAVNEFKGVWVPAEWSESPGDYHTINQCIQFTDEIPEALVGDLRVGGNQVDDDYFTVICTREEFNQCIEDMSTNYGRCSQTYVEYKEECENVSSNIQWSIDDEFIVCTKKDTVTKCWDVNSKYKIRRELERSYVIDELGRSRQVGELTGAIFTNTKIQSPVFTQAMSDAGEFPKVGMMVMTPWGEGKVEVVYMDDICCSNEYGIGVDKINQIMPIDTRTDKERAIDEISNEFLKGGNTFRIVLEAAYDKWVK